MLADLTSAALKTSPAGDVAELDQVDGDGPELAARNTSFQSPAPDVSLDLRDHLEFAGDHLDRAATLPDAAAALSAPAPCTPRRRRPRAPE